VESSSARLKSDRIKQQSEGIELESDTQALQQVLYERFGEDFSIQEGLLHKSQLQQLAALASRCSHRQWTEKSVNDALLQLVLAVAFSAPSKSDLQQSEVVLVQDPQQKEKIAALVPSMPWIAQAPVLMVVCGSGTRLRRIFQRAGLPFVNENLDSFFNATTDASMLLMHLLVAAGAVGLVGVPISVLRDRAEELTSILNLPLHVFPVAGLCLGYPGGERDVTARFALSSSVHVDRHHGSAKLMDQGIDEFDVRYRVAKKISENENQYIENGWSIQKIRQYSKEQRKNWHEYIESIGYKI
jgi:nitroreductase